VTIFGGSVAENLCHGGGAVLRQRLARLPQAAGRKVWIQCYALGGYKQPQQLLALGYALARGERPSLVLNLDGFNDVTLGAVENVPNEVHPFFPRSWHVTAAAMADPALLRRAGEAAYLESRRERRAALADSFPWRYSAVAHALWRALDRAAQGRIASLAAETAAPAHASFLRTGPPYAPRPLDDTLRELAAFWARSSRLMDGLCRSQGIPYFHFLQPNQYVEGSKPMGAAEQKIAFGRHPVYARAARRGYPRLIAEGQRLQADGERFFDLTRIFAQVEEPLYIDDCCHLSPDGTRRLAEEIAARILGASG
jgi:lysophospholipase L1-like esterase